MMHARPMRFIVYPVCLLLVASPAAGQEWPRFRGPNGSGLGRAANVPVEWTEDDFNWRVEIPGLGHASPVLWGRRIFLTSGDEETGARTVFCLDADSGRRLWSRQYARARHRKHDLNSFASSTPAADAKRIYLCYSTGEQSVAAALTHDGEPVWKQTLGPFKSGHGFGISPIVYGNLVVVGNENQDESALVALDRETGDVVWRVPRDTKVTYSTPCVYRPDGRPAELIFTNWKHGVSALDPRTGQTNWEISVFDQDHVETAIGSPVVADGLVFGTCGWLGYNTHTVAVRPPKNTRPPRRRGQGEGSEPTEVYRIDRAAPLTTTPLVVDGLLFLWADDGIVTCADARTGDIHWKKRVGDNYYGSPVAVGGAVYCLSRDGEAVVLAASEDYRELGRNPLGEGSHSTPAVAHGRMYLRTFSHLISLGGG